MAVKPQALAQGQLANTKGTLLLATGNVYTVVRTIRLVNTSAAAVTVNLFVNPAGTSRRIIPKDMRLLANASFNHDDPLTLEENDLIEGDASSATTVDYSIHGVEQDK